MYEAAPVLAFPLSRLKAYRHLQFCVYSKGDDVFFCHWRGAMRDTKYLWLRLVTVMFFLQAKESSVRHAIRSGHAMHASFTYYKIMTLCTQKQREVIWTTSVAHAGYKIVFCQRFDKTISLLDMCLLLFKNGDVSFKETLRVMILYVTFLPC